MQLCSNIIPIAHVLSDYRWPNESYHCRVRYSILLCHQMALTWRISMILSLVSITMTSSLSGMRWGLPWREAGGESGRLSGTVPRRTIWLIISPTPWMVRRTLFPNTCTDTWTYTRKADQHTLHKKWKHKVLTQNFPKLTNERYTVHFYFFNFPTKRKVGTATEWFSCVGTRSNNLAGMHLSTDQNS